MTKDRLPQLKADAEKYGIDEDISIINHFAVVDMAGPFMKDFFDKVKLLWNTIDRISEVIGSIEHLQNALLASPFDFKKQNYLAENMAEMRRLSTNVRKYLSEMKKIEDIQIDADKKTVRHRIAEAHVNIMTKHFCDIMNRYYASEIAYRERCRARVARQFQIAGIEKNEDELAEILEHGHPTFGRQIMADLEQSKQMLHDLEGRHSDILKLERNIRELDNICIDLANLVETQGMNINSIEQYVSEAVVRIERSKSIICATKSLDRSAKRLFRSKRLASSLLSLASRLFASCI
ncbi:unnamed protein product [Rotaria socialis]|uniref:t-SNARE coiled-coil homology domain-containing protein n=1 Tax=Rotaria socialis TaxID=392032 RepID=A0A818RXD2_9BILA|nr:unnamed protein product [Rotaria socialis]CAF3264483.1 unnamed protein product [Rotaria socialis]CAF3414254.1 unnamed protein product [Rotaria socialis]CAF3655324.1 unnamed protein product [Rotaria socialis]CAF3755231.1 unnamed protein product [Rotaria socialis]